MRVVLDANIYISALISNKGAPAKVMRLWQQGVFDVVISAEILAEIGRVLTYPKLQQKYKQVAQVADRFVQLLAIQAIIVKPKTKLNIVRDDETDNRYLECAVSGKATYIITGDKHLLDLRKYKTIAILPPAQFVAKNK